MARQHVPENDWTVRLLAAQPDDHILEIGFGPGLAIERLARQVTQGRVRGVDFSQAMVAAASRRNQAAIQRGMVDLHHGDAASLPFEAGSFDKAFSIHSIYFWPQPIQALNEIYRVLRPNGRLILTILPMDDPAESAPAPSSAGYSFTPYSGERLAAMLRDVGFSSVEIKSDPEQRSPSNYSVVADKVRG
jgi:ubiquinone/menaquinone biosynthesis C-methylase UbiE